MAEMKYRLTDGLEIPLHELTWAKENDATNQALFVWEALHDERVKLTWSLSGVDDNNKPVAKVAPDKVVDRATEIAIMRGKEMQAARDFLLKYLNAKFSLEDITAKIIPQLVDADSILIMRVARQGTGWEQRYMESLWNNDPITTFESKLDALCKTAAGKAYLNTLLPVLQAQLQPVPEATTPPTPPL